MKMGKYTTVLLAGTILAGMAGEAGAQVVAQAQTAPVAATPSQSAPAADDGSLLSDIVVTAQKKSQAELAQKVPISITALSGAQIQQQHITTLRDIGALAPNVALEPNGTVKGLANFTIRGLGANTSIASVEPTVGLFVNGIYQGVMGGQVLDNFDLESIEVLRGPQGTLFGRNVTGGAVVMRTARPTNTFEGQVRATYETGPLWNIAGTVGGPIIKDKILAKITAYYKHDDGWFYDETLGRKFGREKTYFVRPTIILKPTDTIEETIIFQHMKTTGDGVATRNIYLNPRKFELTMDYPGYTDIASTDVTSETNIEVGPGDGKITNLFGYRKLMQASGRDFDSGPTLINHAQDWLQQHQYSDELRYASTFFDIWDLTAGVFLFKQDLFSIDRRTLTGGVITEGGGTIDQKGWGIFTQSDVRITPTLTGTIGLRYSWEHKEAHVARASAARPCNLVTNTCRFTDPDALNADKSWDAFTPKFGLRWQATPDMMIYGTFSKGVRSGGYNVKRSSAADPGIFDQEKLDSGEIGIKSQAFNRHVRINADGFYNYLKGMILNANNGCAVNPVTCPTGVVSSLFNAANAEIYGLEGEVVIAPFRGLELNANVGYTHGRYTKVLADLNGDGVINDIDKHLGIPRLAKWSYNIGGTYTLFTPSSGSIAFQTNYGYRSRQDQNEANTVFFNTYKRLNANITYTLPNKNVSISGFVRNLTNREQNSAATPVVPGVAYYYTIDEGRVWGAELTAKFR